MGLTVLLLAVPGCEGSVDPVIGSEQPFTLWGFMNAGADTQRVRVFPIGDELLPDGSQGIDAQVTSTDLTTGERREWTYKMVEIDSLVTGHIFWSPFRADYEHRYRLEVTRSDGATSSAEVMVPPPVNFEIDVEEDDLVVPVRIEGEVPNLIGFHVTYDAVNVPPGNAWPIGSRVYPAVEYPVTVSYDDQVRRLENGWEVTIDMQADFQDVKFAYQDNCLITEEEYSAPDIWLRAVEFSVLAADSTWAPPGGTFDPEVLSAPGAFSNVENGNGFFGAGQGIRHNWSPSVEAKVNAGYGFEVRCNAIGDPTERPTCMNPPLPCIGENALELWETWLR